MHHSAPSVAAHICLHTGAVHQPHTEHDQSRRQEVHSSVGSLCRKSVRHGPLQSSPANHVKYWTTRNISTHVISMPPIMKYLSWKARFSMRRMTVLDKPSILATSRIFFWVPWVQQKEATMLVEEQLECPKSLSLSTPHSHFLLEKWFSTTVRQHIGVQRMVYSYAMGVWERIL